METTRTQIEVFLEKKAICADVFSQAGKISLESSMAEQVTFVFKKIYSIPYGKKARGEEAIARFFHGIQHVTRAALYIPTLVNLYRKYGDEEAQKLTEQDIKLIQISVLFHDAGREADGRDQWDGDSGLILYWHLTENLDVPKEKAKLLAEAVINKDCLNQKKYKKLVEKNGELIWEESESKSESNNVKNIYACLIHDADCLDLLRDRDEESYKITFLDLYKKYASDDQAMNDIKILVKAVIRIIEKQGDKAGYNNKNPEIKAKYECDNAYENILEDFTNDDFFKQFSSDQMSKQNDDLSIIKMFLNHSNPMIQSEINRHSGLSQLKTYFDQIQKKNETSSPEKQLNHVKSVFVTRCKVTRSLWSPNWFADYFGTKWGTGRNPNVDLLYHFYNNENPGSLENIIEKIENSMTNITPKKQ